MRLGIWFFVGLAWGCSPSDVDIFNDTSADGMGSTGTTSGLQNTSRQTATNNGTNSATTGTGGSTRPDDSASVGGTGGGSETTTSDDGGDSGDATGGAVGGTGAGTGGAAPSGGDGGSSGAPDAGGSGNATGGAANVDRLAPSIVSVSPFDGAHGVDADVTIVVSFSEAMDTEATEAAYTSDSLPKSQVSFEWNAAGDELSIIPSEPLDYRSVTSLNDDPLTYSFGFDTGATDRAGNPLEPEGFEFSTLRRWSVVLAAEPEGELTGTRRSDGSQGVGNCAPSVEVVCGGDSIAGTNVQYFGFASFDSGPVPDDGTLESALLTATIVQIVGDPFVLGAFEVELVQFDEVGAAAMRADALATLGVFAEGGEVGDALSLSVTAGLAESYAPGDLVQFRFSFETATDADGSPDALILSIDSLALELTVLLE